MGARAEAARATRDRILQSTYDLIFECSYDELTLRRVADRADVAFQTVLRHFGSKDGLISAVARRFSEEEYALRTARPGDTSSIAHVLTARYEATADATAQWEALEDRVPVIAAAMKESRAGHTAWLETMFADSLRARRGATRRRFLAQLYAATDINTWRLWRRHLGLSRAQAEAAMKESLDALIADTAARRTT